MFDFSSRHSLCLLTLMVSGIISTAALAQSWEDLSQDNQTILRPLHQSWSDLSDAQKQSWLRRAPELKKMPPTQLDNAQERMAEWSALSQQQRAQVQDRLRHNNQTEPAMRAKLWKDYTGQ